MDAFSIAGNSRQRIAVEFAPTKPLVEWNGIVYVTVHKLIFPYSLKKLLFKKITKISILSHFQIHHFTQRIKTYVMYRDIDYLFESRRNVSRR